MTQPPSWLSLLTLELHARAAGWGSWAGLTSSAVASFRGTLLPAPRAALCLSGWLEAAVASQAAGWLYLETWSLLSSGPGMGVSEPWEDGSFSEGSLYSALFWPVLSHCCCPPGNCSLGLYRLSLMLSRAQIYFQQEE